MKKKHRRSQSSRAHGDVLLSDLVTEAPRVVAMTLATELAMAVSASAAEKQMLVDSALCVGQWLADQGCPGRWDMVKPAAIMRCLDFLKPDEREHFLFSFVGLLGHGALTGQIAPGPVKKSLEEIIGLSEDEAIRTFARSTAQQLRASQS